MRFTKAELSWNTKKTKPPMYEATREGVEIDHAAEKKLVRKLDLNIIPIVMLLYLFSFLDRQVVH